VTRLVARVRAFFAGHPERAVFGGILLLWIYLYGQTKPVMHEVPVPDNQYHRQLARLDGHYMYLNTMSLGLDFDIDLRNQYAKFADPLSIGKIKTATGRAYIYPIGTSLLEVPSFWIAMGLGRVVNLFGAHVPTHGYTEFHQRITYLVTLAAGFFSLILCYRLMLRRVSKTAALYGVVIAGVGTGVHFYSIYGVGYAHAWTALSVAWLFEYWDRTRGRTDVRRWAALGALVGFAMLTRMQEILFAIVPAAEWVWLMARERKPRLLAGAGAAAACALLVASPQLLAQRYVFGGFFTVPQGPHYMHWTGSFVWEVLFSTKHGYFVWTPIAYLGIIGLLFSLVRRPDDRVLAGALLGGFVLQVWVSGSTYDWWGFWGYGLRRLTDCTVCVMFGIGTLVEALRRLHARRPRLAPHAAMVLAAAPLVLLNLELSRSVSEGKQKIPDQPFDTPTLYSQSLDRALNTWRDDVGVPTTWPASWIWAIRHGAPIDRFEKLFGRDLLYVDHQKVGTPQGRQEESLAYNDTFLESYALGPWTPDAKDKNVGWARDGARLLLPIHAREGVHAIIHGKAPGGARVLVNGEPVDVAPTVGDAAAELPIDSDGFGPGTNELVIRCTPADGAPGCIGLDRVVLVYQP
jgi:hypothetical protein